MNSVKLIQGDCLEKMKDIKDNSVDLIVIDPPYKTISGGNKSGLSYKHKGSITEKNDGKIFEHGTAEELAANEQVRRLYLGRNFELRRKDYLHEEARSEPH